MNSTTPPPVSDPVDLVNRLLSAIVGMDNALQSHTKRGDGFNGVLPLICEAHAYLEGHGITENHKTTFNDVYGQFSQYLARERRAVLADRKS